jgi:hypothetical protein
MPPTGIGGHVDGSELAALFGEEQLHDLGTDTETTSSSAQNAMFRLIECTLEHTPPFQTVSYVWGTQVANETLELADGTFLGVTKSLAEALPYIVRACICEYLWIDQLCINQADFPERSQQVKLMREIYRAAGHVIVWLGAVDDCETLEALMKVLYFPTYDFKITTGNILPLPGDFYCRFVRTITSNLLPEHWHTLASLLQGLFLSPWVSIGHITSRASH